MAGLLITGSSGYLGSELARRAPDAAGTYLSAERPGAVRLDVRDADAVARLDGRAAPASRDPHRLPRGRRRRRGRSTSTARATSHERPPTPARGSCTSRPTSSSTARSAARTPRTTSRGPIDGVRAPEARGGGGGARGAAGRARRAHVADLRRRRAEPPRAGRARCGGGPRADELLQRRVPQPGAGGRPRGGAARAGGRRTPPGSCTWRAPTPWTATSSPASSWRPPAAIPDALESALAAEHPDPRPLDCRLDSSRARAREGVAAAGRARSAGRRAKPQETAKAFVWSCMQTIRRRLPSRSSRCSRWRSSPARPSRPRSRSRAATEQRRLPRSTTRPRRASSPSRSTRPSGRSSSCPPTTASCSTSRSSKPKAEGHWPVILEASPYHGTIADRDGTRILPGPKNADGEPIGLTGYFAPRGYAVVMMDLRGTGRSQGCLDHLGDKDARDLEQVVEWAASQDWSNGRVGMTGHSYVGSTPSVAAAQNPTGLKTIVPSAGLASMYHHQFQAGVPYMLQWTGVQWSYNYLTVAADLPPVGAEPVQGANTGDDFGNNPEETGCGAPHSALDRGRGPVLRPLRRLAPRARLEPRRDEGRHPGLRRPRRQRQRRPRSARSSGSSSAGTRRTSCGSGQWDHGVGCCPNRRGIQWTDGASRLVRQAPGAAAQGEHGPAGRAVHVRRPIVRRGRSRRAHGDPHGAQVACRRRRAHLLPDGRRRDGPHGADGGGFAVVHRHARGLRRVRRTRSRRGRRASASPPSRSTRTS